MICSYLNNNDFGFINLHAEQSYTHISESALNSIELNSTRTSDDVPDYLGAAIHAQELTITTIVKLKEHFNSLNCILPKFIFLDFDSITFIQKNLKTSLKELSEILINKSSEIVLLNFNEEIQPSDRSSDLIYFEEYKTLNEKSEKQFFNHSYESILKIREDLFSDLKEKKLISSFREQNPPYLHESSSVYLNQYFNFKRFIGEDYFVYYCLYKLAIKMLEQNESHSWAITPYSKTALFCQTLNSSFIGSILSDLLGIDIYLVDHLGPINKIYTNKLHSELNINYNYIVISDVLCLGTEVKNSKSIIEFFGAKYLGNVAFLRIESRKEKDIDFKDIEYFYRINKTYNPVRYKIITDLD